MNMPVRRIVTWKGMARPKLSDMLPHPRAPRVIPNYEKERGECSPILISLVDKKEIGAYHS